MVAAEGILTARGDDQPCRRGGPRHGQGLRGGRRDLTIKQPSALHGERREGHPRRGRPVITIDGSSGTVMLRCWWPTVEPAALGRLRHADGVGRRRRRLKVRTNAETPTDARAAIRFGAEGIGLCRTEHMFFEPDRIVACAR